LKSDDFDLPNEFSRFEKFIKSDFEQFYPVFQKYQEMQYSSFQSLVYASDDLANTLSIPEFSRINYTQIAMIGYFLLSQFKKVLTFPIPEDNFEAMYFRMKSAKFTGDREVVSALVANTIALMVELKKTDSSMHKAFSAILSMEIASMNSDVQTVQQYSRVFRSNLFDTVLIEKYPLLTLQVVSDLAYREFRTGDEAYSGWLEIYKELAEALNMDTKRLDCYTMLGGLYRFKGYLEEASEYYGKAIVFAEKIGNKEFIASLIANMADLEHTRGNLEKALSLCQEALKDPEISQSKPTIYVNIAEVLIKQEKYGEALEYLDKAQNLTNRNSPIVNLLYGYSLTKIPGKGNLQEGIKYLEKGGNLSEKTKNQRWLTTYYYYMGRIYLDTYDLSSSIESFKKCYDLAIISEFQYVVLSQLYLAEAYLHRYKISKSDADLTNSERYLANVISICQEQDLPILAEVLYISGQLLVALNEFVDAEYIFEQARDLAEKNANFPLIEKCAKSVLMIQSNEIERPIAIIHEITDVINDLAKHSYLKKTKRMPQVYFLNIFTDEGSYIYSYYFNRQFPINDVLISGLISAIRTMSSEVFGSGLRGIDFEGKKLLVESFGRFCGILACDRDSFNARTKLYNFVQRFNQKFEDNYKNIKEGKTLEHFQKEADFLVDIIFEKSERAIITPPK